MRIFLEPISTLLQSFTYTNAQIFGGDFDTFARFFGNCLIKMMFPGSHQQQKEPLQQLQRLLSGEGKKTNV